MMRFLGLAVTLGFIFIGWRIHQSILNPLLSKKKRQEVLQSVNKKMGNFSMPAKENLLESDESESGDGHHMHSSPDTDNRKLYMNANKDFRYTTNSVDEIEMKIKV